MEIWKDVPGYEGFYQVSTLGQVRSVSRIKSDGKKMTGRVLNLYQTKDGYYQIVFYRNNTERLWRVHRLVALAFLPNPKNLPHINHKDCNGLNNTVSNIEWCTPTYNNHYGDGYKKRSESQKGIPKPKTRGEKNGFSKITHNQALSIFNDKRIYSQIATQHGISTTHVCDIKAKKVWKHIHQLN